MNDTIDQLIVRVGKGCNFRCNFCNVSENENFVKTKEHTYDLVRNFHYKFKHSKLSWKEINITISWWEPSIFPKEAIFALKYITSFCKKRWLSTIFDIQTNASNISPYFANKIYELGVTKAMVSFHMIDKDIFEKVIWVSYNPWFQNILNGIDQLKDAGIDVSFNTILSRQNKDNFLPTIKFLIERFGITKNNINIWLIQPHWEAFNKMEEICPKYEEVQYIYNKAVSYLDKIWQPIASHFVWPPACYISQKKYSTEMSKNLSLRKDFDGLTLINKINDQNKTQVTECRSCLYNNVCSGIWHEYIWYQTLKPIAYKKIFLEKQSNFDSKDIDMKSLYDRNVRQIILKSSSFDNITQLHKKLKQATNQGFYKVTLFIDSYTPLDSKILTTGVSNIQINISLLSYDFLLEVIDFSRIYGLQFRINIDIFIDSYTQDCTKKLIQILPLLWGNYIKIYFIYNYQNKDIYKYIPLLKNLTRYKDSIYTVNFYKNMLYDEK